MLRTMKMMVMMMMIVRMIIGGGRRLRHGEGYERRREYRIMNGMRMMLIRRRINDGNGRIEAERLKRSQAKRSQEKY